jgi:gamma-glutamyltranspeptidase/glutathione hydrolase
MQRNSFSTRQEVSGTFGAVASSHWIATQVGMGVLERGGNAFDAATAVGIVMQVVEPHQNSLGGEAVILTCPGNAATPRVICGQGVAPRKANINFFRSLGLDLVPSTGLLAATVPGAFDAWMVMFRDYGTLSIADVISPAIEYAQNGYPLTTEAQRYIAKSAELFRNDWISSAEIYLPRNEPPKAGDIFANSVLAQTYAGLLRESMNAGQDRIEQIEAARTAFYEGFVAERISRFVASARVKDCRGEPHVAHLEFEDMAKWRATYEDAASCAFHGLRVFKPGPWSQGPAFLQFLMLLQDADIFDLDPFGAEYVHRIVENLKLAYADREAWYGDSDDFLPLISALLEDEYTAQRRKLITSEASLDLRPGTLGNREPRLAAYKTLLSGGPGEEQLPLVESRAQGDTCHIDVIDKWGNVVAATPSGGWLHGSPVIPGLGFSLNTRAQMFWLQEGLPSSLVPGKRPRTTLSPTIALDRNGRAVAFGSRGGDYQDQWIAQFFLRHVGHGLDLQQAIDAPMFQSDHWPRSDFPRDASPGKLTLDERFDRKVLDELRDRGHNIKVHPGRRWGRNCAVSKTGRTLRAAASSTIPQSFAAAR